MNELTIIDPPVGPFSPPDEIEAWIEELRAMESSEEVKQAIDDAKEWLQQAVKPQRK